MTEKEDGSVDIEIKMSMEEMRLLIQYAVNSIVRERIEELKLEKPEPPNSRLIKEGEQPRG